MLEIFCTRDRAPSDADILSFWHMIFDPEQLQWDYQEEHDLAQMADDEVLEFYRSRALTRETNYAFWARVDGQIVGMVGMNRFTEPHRAHCAELGFGVCREYRGSGIGTQLLCAALERARAVGLKRIECSCFADNAAAMGLLRKAGFQVEGVRAKAVMKQGQLRDICLLGLLL